MLPFPTELEKQNCLSLLESILSDPHMSTPCSEVQAPPHPTCNPQTHTVTLTSPQGASRVPGASSCPKTAPDVPESSAAHQGRAEQRPPTQTM